MRQLGYIEYKDIYPRTLELIEDRYVEMGFKDHRLNEEDKALIVAKLVEDCGWENFDLGLHEDMTTRLIHFIRHNDEVSSDLLRKTYIESAYGHYEKDIKAMFEAAEEEHQRELHAAHRTHFYISEEKYFDNKERLYAIQGASR